MSGLLDAFAITLEAEFQERANSWKDRDWVPHLHAVPFHESMPPILHPHFAQLGNSGEPSFAKYAGSLSLKVIMMDTPLPFSVRQTAEILIDERAYGNQGSDPGNPVARRGAGVVPRMSAAKPKANEKCSDNHCAPHQTGHRYPSGKLSL
jgi:hypothetical protein